MAEEFKNIIRKEFDTVALASAPSAMLNGQWAWTTVDKVLVIKDELGAFSLIPVPAFTAGKLLASNADTLADFLENKLLANAGIEFVVEEVTTGNYKVRLKAGYRIESKSASFVAQKNVYYLITASTDIVVTLPAPTTTDLQMGFRMVGGSNKITLTPPSGLIGGKATQVIETLNTSIEVKSDSANYQLILDQRNEVNANFGVSTGLLSGGIISLPAIPSSTFNISAGTAIFADTTTDVLNPDVEFIKFPAFTGQAIPSSGAGRWNVYLTRTKTLIIESADQTPQKRRENIYLGFLATPALNTTIQAVLDFPLPALSVAQQLRDLLDILEPVKEGLDLSANATNLTLKINGGWISYGGFGMALSTKSPNNVAISAQTPAQLKRIHRASTSFGADNGDVDVLNYDLAGVVTAIPNPASSCVIHRIFGVPTSAGLIYMQQYGQNIYADLAAANTALANDSDSFVINPALEGTALLGVILAQKDATNLADTTKVKFRSSNKLCEISSGGASAAASTGEIAESYSFGRNVGSASPGIDFGIGVAGLSDGTNAPGSGFVPICTNNISANTNFECAGYHATSNGGATTVKLRWKATLPTSLTDGTQIGTTQTIASPGSGSFAISASALSIPKGSFLWLECGVTNSSTDNVLGATIKLKQ